MGEENPVTLDRRDGIAVLQLNRPERMNALSRATLHAFREHGEALRGDDDVRVIVITGSGDKAFCAGADLKERRDMDENAVRDQLGLYRSCLGWLDESPRPTVAALNGVAFGGGLELALMCDLRIAAAGVKLGLPEVTLGIIPGAGGTQRLPRLVGEAKAKELILFGTRLTAEEALQLGIINRVSPDGSSVLDDALSWVAPLASGAPIAQRAALRAIDASYSVSPQRGDELEMLYYDECLRSSDRVEALRAFAEKRKPRFTGE